MIFTIFFIVYTISNLLIVITCPNFSIFFVYYIHYDLKGFHMFLVQHPTNQQSTNTHQILFIRFNLLATEMKLENVVNSKYWASQN